MHRVPRSPAQGPRSEIIGSPREAPPGWRSTQPGIEKVCDALEGYAGHHNAPDEHAATDSAWLPIGASSENLFAQLAATQPSTATM